MGDKSLIDKLDAGLRVGDDDGFRALPDGFGEQAQALLGFLALRDVAHGRGEVDAVGDGPARQRQIDVEFAAVAV